MQNSQPTLFDEFNDENTSKNNVSITPKLCKPLSKTQERFNKITLRIEKLEKKIIQKEITLEKILAYFNKNIDPLIEFDARNKIKTAFILDEKMLSVKLSKKTYNMGAQLILTLLDDAFSTIVAGKKEIALYDKYADVSFQEEKEETIHSMKMELEMLFKLHGIDIDLTDFDIEKDDEVAKLLQDLQVKIEEKNKAQDTSSAVDKNSKYKEKKKSKKELEREQAKKAKEEAQTKSLKSLYISLSKVLHPDVETDPELKLQKEELMKKVTVAYQEKNFPRLLELEMEWVHQTSENLQELSEEKLKIYISILLERENELNQELYLLNNHPRYLRINKFSQLMERSALNMIDNSKSILLNNEKIFESIHHDLYFSKSKNDIKIIIEDLYNEFI
jgi:hypothetical protein